MQNVLIEFLQCNQHFLSHFNVAVFIHLPSPYILYQQLLYNAGGLTSWQTLITEANGVGSCTALLAEANDAAATDATIKDGESGDTNFPHGNLKPIATVGEYDTCSGEMVVGVPDGIGAYLPDDSTVRVVVQSESYGPVKDFESFPYQVNLGAASFTGSHVQYADYKRDKLARFMEGKWRERHA